MQRALSTSNSPDVLAEIYNPANNIVVWQRELDLAIESSIERLLADRQTLNIEGIATPETDNEPLLKTLLGYDYSRVLVDTVNDLVNMFCYLFDLERAGLRLATLDRAMCPRFHTDKVPCRLVTTFRGVATEWLAHEVVDRSKLGPGNGGLPDDQSGLYRTPADINQLTKGDVALLKGELWEGNENAGIVHRSPEVTNGGTRLLLTLDFVA
ncbi:MAG: DUF1826 domain-containing protein [Pseudomonadota bacterium]